ncbi:hypothetical protein C8J57DRAFT_1237214 [Mycena rebaudengoi]|nr:hypothetical protein C8J57DRAFT_1237214 [Mycena rebaudengoi]
MPSTQKVQVRLDETKAEQNQAVSAKKAHIKGFNPNANITSPKGRESVKNLSRMRQLKLVPGNYWPMAHYLGVAQFPLLRSINEQTMTLERAKIRPPLEHVEYRETQEQNADSLPYNYTEAITSRLTLVRGVQRRSEILEPPVIV